ncbi:zinc-binding dehydrogenase [Leptothermofonsia sp. ETS-13]|uniref:zinc-binding dehydrogenase n=1 Tax=Leptothermofonsia sp. ETS-13 TaxID=3035696 RepID=UPI003B9F17A9
MTLKESMILGTAGLTAALCIDALIHRGISGGDVLVTGSTGSVGSLAVAILAKLGYSVTAVTGKVAQHHGYLRSLGATSILSREAAIDLSGKPLLKERWAGVIDTVGSAMLATVLKSTRGGCVTACGLVGGAELSTTVYPFILRGVCLQGIDSANCPMPPRLALWHKLATDWKPANLKNMAQMIDLSQLPEQIDRVLQGQSVGRVVVVPTTDSGNP